MSFSLNKDSTNASPLLEIAKMYKKEQTRNPGFVADIVNYHEKNPDAGRQIKLLEETDKWINAEVSPEKKPLAQLGILLILRDLLIDPNRHNKVYSYLIEDLELDKYINKVLKQISPKIVFDLTDTAFLKINQQALDIGQAIIDSAGINAALPKEFLQDIRDTVFVEKDYNDKVLHTIEISRKP